MPRPPSPETRAVLDRAACGLMQTADDGTFVRANRTFCEWVGMPEEDLVGKRRFQDLLTMGGRIFHQTHWSPLLRMQGSISEVKLELVTRDRGVLPMVLNASRHEEDGEMVHDLAGYVARDRDRYEQELLAARKRLEVLVAEANELQAQAKDRALFAEQMIGIVSHDLRNPMSTIMMGTELLTNGELAPSQQRVVGRITRATDRATRLISDLLDFTQARLGRGIAVTPATIDLHDTVAGTIEELQLAHPAREIVHARVGSGHSVADADRIAQLLGNLVSNAVAYGPPEMPITVTSSVDAARCAVEVHNGGQPIPAEVQATMFEPMTRGPQPGTKARSVGLGLYIVREIARAHGGRAAVTSTAETGTTFRVELPCPSP